MNQRRRAAGQCVGCAQPSETRYCPSCMERQLDYRAKARGGTRTGVRGRPRKKSK